MSRCDCTSHPKTLHIPKNVSRRDLVKTALLSAGIVALGPLGKASVALGAPRANHKRLVVINMVGGCDTLNVVIPDSLSAYAAARQTGKITNGLPLNGTNYKIHPSMTRFQGLWNAGDALAVQKVGYPLANLSHFESSDILAWGVRNGFQSLQVNKSGWIARYADRYAPTALGAVSIGSGRPLEFTGGVTHGLLVSSLADFRVTGTAAQLERIQYVKDIIHNAPTAGLASGAKDALALAYDLSDQVQAALVDHNNYLGTIPVTYPTSGIARKLRDVAALIHGGFETKIFYTVIEGFDTHAGQLQYQAQLMGEIDAAIGAFSDEMKELGIWEDVAIVVITEFGRRTFWNGSGTDHGHAFAELLVGGSLKGGASYGPELVNADLSNANGGYLAYEVDFRDVYRELLSGFLSADPSEILPETQEKYNTLDFA